MATFTFDGTASQSVAFDPTADQLVFNLPAAGIANVLQDATSVTFIAVSGAVLTLEGVQFADLGDSTSSPARVRTSSSTSVRPAMIPRCWAISLSVSPAMTD